jgi:hypothetical protein
LFPSKNDNDDEPKITNKRANDNDKVVVNNKKYKQVNNAVMAFNTSFELANKLSYAFIKMPYDFLTSIGKYFIKVAFLIKDIFKPIINFAIKLFYIFKLDKLFDIFVNMIEFIVSFPTNLLNIIIGLQNKVMNIIT